MSHNSDGGGKPNPRQMVKESSTKVPKQINKRITRSQNASCKTQIYTLSQKTQIRRNDGIVDLERRTTEIDKAVELVLGQFTTSCRNSINYDHGKEIVEECDYLILSYYKKSVCGFVMCKENPKDNTELYIAILCSPVPKKNLPKTKGVELLWIAEKLAVDLGYKKLYLNSLDNPFCFYNINGFVECDDPCSVDNYGTCAPSIRKVRMGNADDGWRMKKCLNPHKNYEALPISTIIGPKYIKRDCRHEVI
jgi:hypothetical protein